MRYCTMGKLKYLLFLHLLVLLAGCITENLLPCDTTVFFCYRGDGTEDIFDEKIEVVNLYIYDDNNSLYQVKIIGKEEWSGRGIALPDLPVGSYDLICWGGAGEYTAIKEANNKITAGVYAGQYLTGESITTVDSLYYGFHRLVVDNFTHTTDTIFFESAHIKMLIRIHGLEVTSAEESEYSLELDRLNPFVSINHVRPDEKVCFNPVALFDKENNNYVARLNVFRFDNENDIILRLPGLSEADPLFTLKLEDFMHTYNLTVEGIHEVSIDICIYFNGVKIVAEPWDESKVYPEW